MNEAQCRIKACGGPEVLGRLTLSETIKKLRFLSTIRVTFGFNPGPLQPGPGTAVPLAPPLIRH
jgi:hypothetical protein